MKKGCYNHPNTPPFVIIFKLLETNHISIAECARLLTASGDKISATGLAKYVNKHGLIRGRLGKAKLVNLQEVTTARESFTREVMRGETNPASKNYKPAKTAPATSRRKSKAKLRAVDSTSKSDNVISEDHIDRARAAKASREEIELESKSLDLALKKGELVPTHEVEAAFIDAMSKMKSHFLGSNLSTSAEKICVVLGLPDTKKRQAEDILRVILSDGLTKFGEDCTKSLSELTPAGLPDRLAALNELAATLYTADLAKARTA